jgi:hypothetical protein
MRTINHILSWLFVALTAIGLTACNDNDDTESSIPDISGTYQGKMIYYDDNVAGNDTVAASWTISQNQVQVPKFSPKLLAGKVKDDNLKNQLRQLATITLKGDMTLYHSNPDLYHVHMEDVSLPVNSNGQSTTLKIRFDDTDCFLAYDRTSKTVILQIKAISASLANDNTNLLTDTPSYYFFTVSNKDDNIYVHN